MKKFYTLALATAVALSASAERQQAAGKFRMLNAELTDAVKKEMPVKRMMKAPAKAASLDDVTALDTWACYGLLTNQTTGEDQGEMTMALEIVAKNAATGEVAITLANSFEIKGTFDASNATLTIPNKQYLGTDDDGAVYFYLKSVTSDGSIVAGASAVTSTVGTLENGVIVFPELEIWACGDPDNENLGHYFMTAENMFGRDPYYSLGMGKYLENIVYPTFMQGEENKTVCDVEVLTDGEGHYIVVDPLKALYAAKGWSQYESPELYLDATDPANIIININETGIAASGTPYVYFSESYLAQNPQYEEQNGGPMDTKYCITKTVDGDNVTITFPEDCATLWLYGTQSMYYAAVFPSTLTFKEEANAGIGSVAVEEEHAPAVYYNLQGVRVENPAKGVVIRVQNGKASKMLVK